jgi:hypothetical protein
VEVAVEDPRLRHRRAVTLEPPGDLLETRQVAHLDLPVLLGPPGNLAIEKALGPAETLESDIPPGDGVQQREDVDERLADLFRRLRLRRRLRRQLDRQAMSGDLLHQQGGRFEPRHLVGVANYGRHRDGRLGQRGEDRAFPAHTVRRRVEAGARRPAQDQLAIQAADDVGLVGVPT